MALFTKKHHKLPTYPKTIKKLFNEYCVNVDEALEFAYEKLGRDASVIVMPYGGSTLPKIR